MSVLGIILRITDDSYSSCHWSDYSGSSAVAQPITLYDHALFSIYILKKDPSQNYKLKYPFVDNLPTAKWATFSLLQWSFWIKNLHFTCFVNSTITWFESTYNSFRLAVLIIIMVLLSYFIGESWLSFYWLFLVWLPQQVFISPIPHMEDVSCCFRVTTG